MGIISHCYYDNGVISQKFQFVLRYILGSRSISKNVKAIEDLIPQGEIQENQVEPNEVSSGKQISAKDSKSNRSGETHQSDESNPEQEAPEAQKQEEEVMALQIEMNMKA